MALTRRAVNRMSGNIWPGFVDAMTALLLVLMFVLTIFMIVQFMLRETITGQENQLDELSNEMNALAQALGLEQQRAFRLEEQVETLQSDLGEAEATSEQQLALIASLTAQTESQADQLAAQTAQITSFEAQVASLLAERDEARQQGEALAADLEELQTEQEALQLALATARDEIDSQAEAARLAAARREAMDALVAELRARTEDQQSSLADALARLQSSEQEIADLSTSLDRAETALSDEEAARLREAAAAEALRKRLADAEGALSQEEQERLAEAAAAEALRARLQASEDELTAMTLALEEKRREAEETLTLLAAARAAEDELGAQLAVAQEAAEQLTEIDRQRALLAEANRQLADEEAKSADSLRKIEVLNQQIAALRTQLGTLQALLDDAADRDAAAQVRIQTLGSDLNTALARVAAEQKKRAELEEAERKRLEAEAKQLENYRSEFFGEMRAILGDREGVRIVGDRFVFSSEVLFDSASANLSDEGKAQIERVAGILDEVSDKIPPEIDWVIRVDGHTDKTPLSGSGRYRDNWELSQARALAVVQFMTDELGFPPDRLAATGFGEFQPVAEGDSPEALARNRRIELKLTER